ncbi:hypothetical protein D7Z54_31150 [Salibacterium salarium]|uniref:Uncharacterized protein n=1 Tax=Salibacterium salarium TaxID=284579 RepID=A0A3R9R8B2_9BACI|nr:hypothetical protein [Salibacterium salarium]RSL29456.1 hypothetical protein D7Z54_31150 [Salibacterium salarium]
MDSQYELLNKIAEKQQEIASDWATYWTEFSSFSTWGFWFDVVMFALPLLLLYFKLDRTRAFQIGFFGFNVHVWFGYFDTFGTVQGYWTYPYQISSYLPNSLGMDASLVPVLFMLLYQWVTNTNRNYYVYSLLLGALLSFVLKPIFVSINLFKFYMGANYFHLFLTYIVIIVLSKLITDLFLHFQKESSSKVS